MLSRAASLVVRGAGAHLAPTGTTCAAFSTFYTPEHEYAQVADDGTATCGITTFAQEQLGDIVYVGLPDVGDEVEKGDVVASVESVKAASDVYAVVSGTVLEVNEALNDDPALVNASPEESGWFVKIAMKEAGETAELLDQQQYAAHMEEAA